MLWGVRYVLGVVAVGSIAALAVYAAGRLFEWNLADLSVELLLNPVVLLALLLLGFVKYGFSSY